MTEISVAQWSMMARRNFAPSATGVYRQTEITAENILFGWNVPAKTRALKATEPSLTTLHHVCPAI
jgi:hypothetical protein